MILLSDGAQNALYPRDEAPQTPARFMAEQGVPLYTVTFGKAGTSQQRRDVAVTELDVSPTVFVKNELVIRGTVRISGYTNQDVPVQALFETEPGKAAGGDRRHEAAAPSATARSCRSSSATFRKRPASGKSRSASNRNPASRTSRTTS